MLEMLPNLEIFTFSFSPNIMMRTSSRSLVDLWVVNALHWLISEISTSLQLRWDFSFLSHLKPELEKMMASRGSIQKGESATR